LGRDQVLPVGGPYRAAALLGDLARVVAASRIAVPDAGTKTAVDQGLAVGGDAAVMPAVRDLLPFSGGRVDGDDQAVLGLFLVLALGLVAECGAHIDAPPGLGVGLRRFRPVLSGSR